MKRDNQYYRIPASFAGKSLETLYADYLALLDEAKVEIVSKVRRTDLLPDLLMIVFINHVCHFLHPLSASSITQIGKGLQQIQIECRSLHSSLT